MLARAAAVCFQPSDAFPGGPVYFPIAGAAYPGCVRYLPEALKLAGSPERSRGHMSGQ